MKIGIMEDFKEYENLKLEEVCRICLTKKNEMAVIAESESDIENILFVCASIQLLEEDRSHYICLNCVDKLNEWYNFNQQVIKSLAIGRWLIEERCINEKTKKVCGTDQGTCLDTHSLEKEQEEIKNPEMIFVDLKEEECETDDNFSVFCADDPISINSHCHEEILFNTNSVLKPSESEFVKPQNLAQNVEIKNNIDYDTRTQCDAKFSSKSTLIIHISQHTSKSFECDKCGKQFKQRKTLNDHIRRHYNSRNFACIVCGKAFYKQYNVIEHMRMHTGERPFKCDICQKTFTRARLLRNHIKKIHTKDVKFICEICTKSFVDSYQLKMHMRTHTGEKPYHCQDCGNAFALQNQLNSHIKYKHTKQKDFICNVCARTFTARQSLQDHLNTHSGEKREKRHECTLCGKKCITTTQLKIHIRSHTGERPFSCELCEKGFTSRCSLEAHIRTHTGEKSYVCNECGKAFRMSSTLKTHMRTHTGERPFGCIVCNKNFSQASTLNTHMKTHK